jgi:BCD family chlorophyll transporter-like MFS transporter
LISLAAAGALEGRVRKRSVAQSGGWTALAGFVVITLSGLLHNETVFYAGVVLLGLGTGLATVSNLSLMLDMTTAGSVGLYIGAWGMANAFSRLIGNVLSGALRDTIVRLVENPVIGYLVVFGVEALLLVVSLWILTRIDVGAFRRQAGQQMSVLERTAMVE